MGEGWQYMKNNKWGTIVTVILLILSGIIILLAMFYFVITKEDAAFLEKKSMEETNTVTKEKDEIKEIGKADKTVNADEAEEIDNETVNASNNTGGNEIKAMDNKKVFEIQNITDEIFERMKGKSYKKDCTIPIEDLKYLTLSYYGYDGNTHTGEMIVNALIAEDTLQIFQELYEAKYPIERMELVDAYDADDIASMEANNTSAFNFRYIEGTTRYSNHAMGFAIDINPLYNPYVRNKDGKEDVLPVTAKAYSDRTTDCMYYIKKDDICYQIFTKYGFTWGGEWNNSKDYQHFEKIIEK